MAKSNKAAAALLGRQGGLARAKSLDPERRREISRQAANTRWAKTWGAKTYVLDKPDGRRRLTILVEDFIRDLARHLGPTCYVEPQYEQIDQGVAQQVVSVIRFHHRPYGLSFIPGGTIGADRVFISLHLIGDHHHLATMSVSAKRAIDQIANEVRKKLLDNPDGLAVLRQGDLIGVDLSPVDQVEPLVDDPPAIWDDDAARRALHIIARHLCPRAMMSDVAQMALDGYSVKEIEKAAGLRE